MRSILVLGFLVVWCGTGDVAEAKKLKAKTYKKDYTLDDGEVLEGAGTKKTTIKGTIRVRDRGTLRNLTIKGGRVTVLSGASLTIENVVVDDAPGVAIETRGGGTLVVRNSAIVNAGGKAFYIQRGKHIVITGTTVRGAGEEGIDIRSGVSGTITGNTIVNNRESGIEVILGNTSLTIANNTISGNRASGIATQYYSLAQETGDVRITNNKIVGNRNYAIDCKIPSRMSSGKRIRDGYWQRSLKVVDNVFARNSAGSIAPLCGRVYNVDSEAVRRAREEARKAAEEKARQAAEAERRAREVDQQRHVLTEAEQAFDEHLVRIKEHKEVVDAYSWVRVVFVGVDQAHVEALRAQRDGLMRIAQTLRELERQQLDEAERKRAAELKARLDTVVTPLDSYIVAKEHAGLWHRITRLWR